MVGKRDDGKFVVTAAHINTMLGWRNVKGGMKGYYADRTSIAEKKTKPNSDDVACFVVDRAITILKDIVHTSREITPEKFRSDLS